MRMAVGKIVQTIYGAVVSSRSNLLRHLTKVIRMRRLIVVRMYR